MVELIEIHSESGISLVVMHIGCLNRYVGALLGFSLLDCLLRWIRLHLGSETVSDDDGWLEVIL